jgi:hypothetical protein
MMLVGRLGLVYEGCGGAMTAERIPPVLNAPNSRRDIYAGDVRNLTRWWHGGSTLMFHSGSISLARVSVTPSRAVCVSMRVIGVWNLDI